MTRIEIPNTLVNEVKDKLSKDEVKTFLEKEKSIKGQYGKLRLEFKNTVLSGDKRGTLLLTMAMQKALGFKGKDIDGKIGPNTVAKLEKIAGVLVKSKAQAAPGQAPERPGQVAGDLYPDYASLYYVDQPGQTPVNATEAEKKDMAKKYKYNQKAHKKVIADYKKMGGTEEA